MTIKEYLENNGIKATWFARNKLGLTEQYFNSVINGKIKAGKVLKRLIYHETNGQVTEADWE